MAGMDPSKGKYYEGTLANGQDGSKWKDLSFKGEGETKEIYGGEGKRLVVEKGESGNKDGREEAGFKLDSKGYEGPENWTPKDLGVCNPDSTY